MSTVGHFQAYGNRNQDNALFNSGTRNPTNGGLAGTVTAMAAVAKSFVTPGW